MVAGLYKMQLVEVSIADDSFPQVLHNTIESLTNVSRAGGQHARSHLNWCLHL
jgi:hypothetical protein